MAFKDVRAFTEMLDKHKELAVVKNADWDLELGGLTELGAEFASPAFLFDEIKGFPKGFRVLVNNLSTPKRFALALGMSPDMSKMDIVKEWRKRMKSFKGLPPKEVSDGPIKENVQQGDKLKLTMFPTPRWHEGDGGRFIGTECMVIMRDPDSGYVNYGAFRVQVHDDRTAGLYIAPGRHGRIIAEKYHAAGKNCPVVVSCGQEPLTWIPAFYRVPYGLSEYDFAGWLRGEPVPVIVSEITGLPIPAFSELVIEGEVPPPSVEMRPEGPFGEYTGYYASGESPQPVIRIKRIMYRNDPIITGKPPLKPGMVSDVAVPLQTVPAVWDQLEAAGVPDVKGVWEFAVGNRMMVIVSIKQRYAGHSKQAGLVTSGCHGAGQIGRFVIVVDDDIDITNMSEVMWAVATRCDPKSGITIIDGTWSGQLDPLLSPHKRTARDFTNSRAIIDACRPFSWMKEFPAVNRVSEELRQQLLKKWSTLLKNGKQT